MIKQFLKKLKHRVVLYVFNYYFGKLVYGFETAEEKLKKSTETQRGYYYRAVTEWYNSEAYNIETQGEFQDILSEIAKKVVSEDILTAYRLILLREKSKEIRLKSKIEEYQIQQSTLKHLKN